MGKECLYAQKVSKVYKKVLSQHLKVKTTWETWAWTEE